MTERRMDVPAAEGLFGATRSVLDELEGWQANHPNVADYRVNDALRGLRLALKALGHLYRDEHYPEHVAAREALAEFLEG